MNTISYMSIQPDDEKWIGDGSDRCWHLFYLLYRLGMKDPYSSSEFNSYAYCVRAYMRTKGGSGVATKDSRRNP